MELDEFKVLINDRQDFYFLMEILESFDQNVYPFWDFHDQHIAYDKTNNKWFSLHSQYDDRPTISLMQFIEILKEEKS